MQMTPIDTASATEVSGTIRVRLGAKLKVAPENVRANSKPAQDDISGLCDSIASPVGLLNPLVGYRRSIMFASGRFAMLDDGLGFTLVPWKPVIEQRLGQSLAATVRGGHVSWELGRQRGPSVG